MASKKRSKTTRKAAKDLPLTGRAATAKVKGGVDLRGIVEKVETNRLMKEQG